MTEQIYRCIACGQQVDPNERHDCPRLRDAPVSEPAPEEPPDEQR